MFVLKHDVLFLTLPIILFTCHILQTDFWGFFGAFHSIPSILLFLSQLVWNVLRPSNSEYLEDLWSRWGITLNRLYRIWHCVLCIQYVLCTYRKWQNCTDTTKLATLECCLRCSWICFTTIHLVGKYCIYSSTLKHTNLFEFTLFVTLSFNIMFSNLG